jgi:hypothetical protein
VPGIVTAGAGWLLQYRQYLEGGHCSGDRLASRPPLPCRSLVPRTGRQLVLDDGETLCPPSSHPSHLAYRGGATLPYSSLSLSTEPGWVSKFAGTPCRVECLDEMSRPWTATTATKMETNAKTIVRTGTAFQIVETDKPLALPSERRGRFLEGKSAGDSP